MSRGPACQSALQQLITCINISVYPELMAVPGGVLLSPANRSAVGLFEAQLTPTIEIDLNDASMHMIAVIAFVRL